MTAQTDSFRTVKDRPIIDHTVKGCLVGILTWVLMHYKVDHALIALIVPIANALLGKLSMLTGLKGVASFLASEVDE